MSTVRPSGKTRASSSRDMRGHMRISAVSATVLFTLAFVPSVYAALCVTVATSMLALVDASVLQSQ